MYTYVTITKKHLSTRHHDLFELCMQCGKPGFFPFFPVELWFPTLTIMPQYCKHLYIVNLNKAQTLFHSSNVNDHKRGQGGTAVRAVTFIEERTCLQAHAARAYIPQLVTLFQWGFSQCLLRQSLFKTITERGKSVNCNYTHKTQPAAFAWNDSVPGDSDGHVLVIQYRAHISVWAATFSE